MYQSAPVAPGGTVADRFSTVSLTARVPFGPGAMFPSMSVSCGSLLPNRSDAVWGWPSHRALQLPVDGGGGGVGRMSLTGVVVPSKVCIRLVTSGTPQPET